MLESYENALQVAVLLACSGAALYQATRFRSRTWTLLALFFGSWLLGDLYWLSCLVFYDSTPKIPVVSDMSWYAGYLFLYMLLRQIAPPEKGRRKSALAWVGPVFTMGMAVFYMQWGQIVSNLVYASLLGLLLFSVIRRITDRETYRNVFPLCRIILVFCLAEYGMWTVSCFFEGEGLSNPYYWFDALMTLVFPFFLPAVRKAVKK